MTHDTLLVHGGRPLRGEVRVRGAKNLVPKAMVAALLGHTASQIRNVPELRDTEIVRSLLSLYGVSVTAGEGDDELRIDSSRVQQANPRKVVEHAGSSRIPILFSGPLLHRLGQAFIPGLGGCEIGGRALDFHYQVLRYFGAEIEAGPSGVHLRAPRRLRGIDIRLPYPSVGATEQVLLTAVLAEGDTELRNAAIEPEIVDLICVLQKMGAIITLASDRTIVISGVDSLVGYTHRALPDRLETASWACAALATEGDIYVRGASQTEMTAFLYAYRKVGGLFDIDAHGIRFRHPGRPLSAISLETDVHPGFQTDWQQPMLTVLALAEGTSRIHETVYESRLGLTDGLKQMGTHVRLSEECLGARPCRFDGQNHQHSAVISGVPRLQSSDLKVPDLRGGFAYLIAALAAKGTSRLDGISLIDRGYERFLQKLEDLGADVELITA
ncbi:UDP-N-acetylglucosamine 1-carboxyvinyltransferase [Streptomyces sp. NPDC089799]|uniref:UDP-N-acetylglucosamine 1-carboxyvinyltransferase n=1 Tax=Streptomyces sp. NPDC089799 TaxID=3155066 RepID=UPI00341B09E8